MRILILYFLIICCAVAAADQVEVKVLNTNTPVTQKEKKKIETKLSEKLNSAPQKKSR